MDTHHRMLSVRVPSFERQTLFDRHRRTKGRLDAVTSAKTFNLRFHLFRQMLVSLHHIGPHGVPANGWALQTTQYAAHWRRLAPRSIGVPGVLVALDRAVRVFIDLNQPRVIRVATDDRVIFQLTEAAGKGRVLGATDVLITHEQHAMLEQLGTDLGEQALIMNGIGKVDARQLCTNAAGKLFNLHGGRPP